VLAKFTIPAAKMRLFVEMVMEERHSGELSSLLSTQYREKSSVLRDSFNELFDRKAQERQKLLDSLLSRGKSPAHTPANAGITFLITRKGSHIVCEVCIFVLRLPF
jgi:hypothetical protein